MGQNPREGLDRKRGCRVGAPERRLPILRKNRSFASRGNSSLVRSRFASCFLMKQRFAAAVKGQKLCFVQSVALDGCPVAMPVERAMPPGHGPEKSVKKVETDAEVGVHEAFAVHAAVMNVVHCSGFQEPRSKERNSRHPEVSDVQPS